MTSDDWGPGSSRWGCSSTGGHPRAERPGERGGGRHILLCFNAHSASVEFLTPDGDYAAEWTAALDTSAATGSADLVVRAGESVTPPPLGAGVPQDRLSHG